MSEKNVYEEILCAGFGGQGIMLLGKLLAYAGMTEGKHVTYLPSYGAEVRGGTAHCNVIISSEEIASPIVTSPSIAIIMNQPSLVKFEPRVQPAGLLLLNSTLVFSETSRSDVEILRIPATQTADQLGTVQCANMIMLGSLLARTQIVKRSTIIEGLEKTFSKKKHDLIELNARAIDKGAELLEAESLQ